MFEKLGCDECGRFYDLTPREIIDYKTNYLYDEDKTSELLSTWRLPPQTFSVIGYDGQPAQVYLNDLHALNELHQMGLKRVNSMMCRGQMGSSDRERTFDLKRWHANQFKITRAEKDYAVANMLIVGESDKKTGFVSFFVTPTATEELSVYIDWICSAPKVAFSGRRIFEHMKEVLLSGFPTVNKICVELMKLAGKSSLERTYQNWGFRNLNEKEEEERGIWRMKHCFERD
jgi:hypothetical protein